MAGEWSVRPYVAKGAFFPKPAMFGRRRDDMCWRICVWQVQPDIHPAMSTAGAYAEFLSCLLPERSFVSAPRETGAFKTRCHQHFLPHYPYVASFVILSGLGRSCVCARGSIRQRPAIAKGVTLDCRKKLRNLRSALMFSVVSYADPKNGVHRSHSCRFFIFRYLILSEVVCLFLVS